MGALVPSVDANPDLGVGKDKSVTKPIKAVGKGLDNTRATFIEMPLLIAATALLYDKAWVQGHPNREFTLGDWVLVILVSYFLKRLGVGNRWEAMF